MLRHVGPTRVIARRSTPTPDGERDKEIDALVAATMSAIARSRFVFLLLNIVCALIVASTFNDHLAWSQRVYARTYHATLHFETLAREKHCPCASLTMRSESLDADEAPPAACGSICSELYETNKKLDVFRTTVFNDLRGTTLPLLGIRVDYSDMTVLGSSALTILYVWFWFAMRRENKCARDVWYASDREKLSPGLLHRMYLAINHQLVLHPTIVGRVPGVDALPRVVSNALPWMPLACLGAIAAWLVYVRRWFGEDESFTTVLVSTLVAMVILSLAISSRFSRAAMGTSGPATRIPVDLVVALTVAPAVIPLLFVATDAIDLWVTRRVAAVEDLQIPMTLWQRFSWSEKFEALCRDTFALSCAIVNLKFFGHLKRFTESTRWFFRGMSIRDAMVQGRVYSAEEIREIFDGVVPESVRRADAHSQMNRVYEAIKERAGR